MARIRVSDITADEVDDVVAALESGRTVRSVSPWKAWTRHDPHATTGAICVDAIPLPAHPARATAVRAEVDASAARALPGRRTDGARRTR